MEIKDLEIKKLKKEIRIKSIKEYAFVLLFVAEIIFLAIIFARFLGIENPLSTKLSPTKVAHLRLDKEITSPYIQDLIEAIEKIKEEKEYKALLLEIASPGGSPTASQEFAEYLKDLNQTMPITMYIDSIAASGAYYIASAIKPIYANKNAIVGSIGVIMPHYNAKDLAKKVGIKEETITAGKFKQPFSFFKEMTPENKRYIEESLLKPTYKNFLEDVAINRHITPQKLEKFAQGKIYIANMPEIQGVLVDKISNLFQIKKALKKRYGKETVFENIAQKKSPKNIFHVLFQEKIQNLFEEQLTLK